MMKTVRCAIYTRKSSDEGLEQSFNSLDAQREACAAYILSQASEGWTALPERYDDGGISGGTLERPALQRLLADIAEGGIDIVVVYKVDRLSRSLFDFAKLVEAFDAKSTSFVSVTQSFNTTTSMGRLTLNMLLSFAQFEREVTAERIRDKIAASKAKGMWMGGIPPLGYEPDGRSLKVIEDHAAMVRRIFDLYLALGNVRRVADQLAREGLRSPVRVKAKSGAEYGGVPLTRGQIYGILKCPTYIGEVHHHGKVHAGLHQAIVAREVWDKVQAMLAANLQGHRRGMRVERPSLLAGKVVDRAGDPLIATHACKGKVRYRYYVSHARHHGDRATGWRIPARELETALVERLACLFDDGLAVATRAGLAVAAHDFVALCEQSHALAQAIRQRDRLAIEAIVTQVRVEDERIAIRCSSPAIAAALGAKLEPCTSDTIEIGADVRLRRSGRSMRLVQANGSVIAATPNPALIRLLVKARRWWAELRKGELDITMLANREAVQPAYVTRVLRLAFLSPQVVEAILKGTTRSEVSVGSLTLEGSIPAGWHNQAQMMSASRV